MNQGYNAKLAWSLRNINPPRFYFIHMNQGNTVKKMWIWESKLESIFYFVTLLHMKRPHYYTISNLNRSGLWLRSELIFWCPTTSPLFISCSPTPAPPPSPFLFYWLFDSRHIGHFQSSLSVCYLSVPFQNSLIFSFYPSFSSPFLSFSILSLFPSMVANHGICFYWGTRVECHVWFQPYFSSPLFEGNRYKWF